MLQNAHVEGITSLVQSARLGSAHVSLRSGSATATMTAVITATRTAAVSQNKCFIGTKLFYATGS